MRRRRLPEPFAFYVDECLGRHVVPDALRAALLPGEEVVTLPQGTQDEDWLPRAGERWVCFTKDGALRRRPTSWRPFAARAPGSSSSGRRPAPSMRVAS